MRYAQIRQMDISNGEGIGVSLFVQGCHFHCKNCFNSETWDFDGGKEWTDETTNRFLELIQKTYVKRISILGGEPLAEENVSSVFELVNTTHLLFPEKIIWLYTGYTWEDLYPKVTSDCLAQTEIARQLIVEQCDVVVDGRFKEELKDIALPWRGSSNQRVINVKQTLQQGKIVLWK